MIQPPGLFLIGLVCQTNDEAVCSELSEGRAAQLRLVVVLLRAGEYISQNVTTSRTRRRRIES